MAKIRNEDIFPAREAIKALKQYTHPVTLAGIRNQAAINLGILDRHLRIMFEDFVEANNDIAKRYGNPETGVVKRVGDDGKINEAFLKCREEQIDLGRQLVEIEDKFKIKLSELKVRNEDGELVEVESGRIADLEDLLIREEEEERKFDEPVIPLKTRSRAKRSK